MNNENNTIDYDIIISENIKRIKKHKYFNGLRLVNSLIYKYTIECMNTSMMYCKHKEVLILVDYFNKIKMINYGSYIGVDITKSIGNTLKHYYNINFIAIHNHPKETNISLKDIKTFLSKRNINLMIIVTNTCRYQSALYKTRELSKQELLILKNEISKFNNQNFNIYNILSMLYSCGIQYKEFRNY